MRSSRLGTWSPTALGAALAALALAGCGLSEDTRAAAERTKSQIEQRAKEIEVSRQALEAFKTSDASVGFRNAIEREQWDSHFALADEKIREARESFEQNVQPILDSNDSSLEYGLLANLETIAPILKSAKDESDFWKERSQSLATAKANAAQLRTEAQAGVQQIEDELAELRTRAAAAKKEFAEQSVAIDQMMAPLAAVARGAQDALASFEAQYKAHASGAAADYGVLASESERLQTLAAKMTQGTAAAEAKFAELSHSYAKTLTDMKAEYAMTIRRQSWDESAEYPSLHDHDYARTMDGAMFDYLDDVPGSLATFSKGWFSNDLALLPGIDQAHWDALKIDPEEQWPDGDNMAEIWVETATAQYFHKYHVVENGAESETDWVPVDEAFFFANLDNLGMDVEAKPYGMFEENKLTHAAPPGMAYVGNERYGRWERQGGGMVWTWIAPYLFYRTLFGNPWMYTRDEYNTWHSGYYGSRAYYGGTSSAPIYGTHGRSTQTSPTLSSSTFGRSGGFSRPSGSVRGAGPASRGGGFGGSGK
ncbi:MAG: hypothetical protein GC160_13985 [Acidobacteria bacterium]|nr:hypothetical protein [Acidobacteriota bacterium]